MQNKGKFPSTTESNPKEHCKTIELRSGIKYQGPPLPNELDEAEDDKVSEKDEDEEIAPSHEDEEEKGMMKNNKEEMKKKQKKDECTKSTKMEISKGFEGKEER
ncbi:hypothetical protein ACS0TY_027576 [Phlomoides rotata]